MMSAPTISAPAISDWDMLSDDLQLTLSRAALVRAAETIAGQAEVLAREIDSGMLHDRGAADMLRLFARIVRLNRDTELSPAGHA